MMIRKVKLLVYWLVKNRIAFWLVGFLLLFCIFLEIRCSVIRRSSSDEQGAPLAADMVTSVGQQNWKEMWQSAQRAVSSKCPVLVVRAGRGGGLRRLLPALAAVRGIRDALLVVSHSFRSAELSELVRGVRFCRVLQVFYPFSRQLHPDRFPGPDPSDCSPTNTSPLCQPRDAARTETKHHMWWTMHFVFDRYIWGDAREGIVLFLQEDDDVTPDLLHMLQYAQRALAYHPEADLVSLGRPYAEGADGGLLRVEAWRPPFDRGLAFNRSLFDKIQALAHRYCAFDDVSWSYSLLHLFAGLPRGHARMVAPAAPRVLAPRAAAARRPAQFPARVRSLLAATRRGRTGARLGPPRGAGGWSDERDRLLCLDPLLATTTDVPPPSTMANVAPT